MKRFIPFVLLALGVALSIVQLSWVRPDVFYSGDAGIKYLMTKQFAAGDWHADLRLAAPPWVEALWQEGLYPFGPPFVYAIDGRRIVQYPLSFMALTAPFYAAFGYMGIYVVPTLSLWALWACFLGLTRRLELSWSAASIGLGGLIFTSFVTPYGAIFFEHTLAIALSFAGLGLLLPTPRPATRPTLARDLAGGFLLGASVWFRPESACFAAGVLVCLALLRVPPRRGLAIGAALATVGVAFCTFNFLLYGSPLGVHAIQQVDPSTLHLPRQSLRVIARGLGFLFLDSTPVLVVAAALAVYGLVHRPARTTRLEAGLWTVVAFFAVGTWLVVPNTGGTQIGARYLMHAVPLLWLIVALQWHRAAGHRAAGASALWTHAFRIVVAFALLIGGVRSFDQSNRLQLNYDQRIRPTLEFLRSVDGDIDRENDREVVAVEHQWMAQELAATFEEKTFFRLRIIDDDLNLLADALAERGTHHFTMVLYGKRNGSMSLRSGFSLRVVPRGSFGDYYLYDCRITPSS